MRVRLLGTAAGGGFPQWNCNCANCRAVRTGSAAALPRTQSCVTLSADGRHWFLLNASPDLRAQIESFPPLLARGRLRGTAIEGILLTNADLDHTLGLLLLREGGALAVHATAAVRQSLTGGLNLAVVLDCYGGVTWHDPPAELQPLALRDGSPSGLRYLSFPVPGQLPRYRACYAERSPGDTIGYRLQDELTGGRLVFVPALAALDATVLAQFSDCDAFLLDGTFWSEEEMRSAGVGALGASAMGHLPVGGPGGSLGHISRLPARHKVYLHVNNTNPMLLQGSAEQQAVDRVGATVGFDGMEFSL
jgi:pyrroloquinoline quinone biosynthesis protein B